MNLTSPNDLRNGPPEDNLDRLLSDFFQSKMKQPWPAAPATTTWVPASEPSVLVAARAGVSETPRNQPVAQNAHADHGNKARYTLTVSVALLLGTCWSLSNGFQPGERSGPGVPPGSNAPSMLKDAGASDPAALKELRKDKAEKGDEGGFTPPKIKLP